MSEHESEHQAHEDNTDLALPGQRLKKTREELRLSRDEVAHHLHLDVKVVNALEDDDFDKLPSPAYICGYLRSYARILKLPEDDVVNSYRKGQEINATLIPNNMTISPDRRINFAMLKYMVILIAVVGIGAGLIWAVDKFNLLEKTTRSGTEVIFLETPDEDTPVERPVQIQQQIPLFNPATESERSSNDEKSPGLLAAEDVTLASTEHHDETSKEVETREPAKGNLKLVFRKDSWAEVVDAKGIRHIYRLVNKNSELFIDGVPPYTILLGHADGVDVIYNNKKFNHKRFHRDQIAYFRLGLADNQALR